MKHFLQSKWKSDILKNTPSSVLLLKYKNSQMKMWFSVATFALEFLTTHPFYALSQDINQ